MGRQCHYECTLLWQLKSLQRTLKYIPFSLQDIKVTEKSVDTGDEAPEVSTLFNTYIPLGDTVPVRLSNKCFFYLFLLSQQQYTRPM